MTAAGRETGESVVVGVVIVETLMARVLQSTVTWTEDILAVAVFGFGMWTMVGMLNLS